VYVLILITILKTLFPDTGLIRTSRMRTIRRTTIQLDFSILKRTEIIREEELAHVLSHVLGVPLTDTRTAWRTHRYRAFNRFGQAKFTDGGLILGSSFQYYPSCLKKTAQVKSGQNWPKKSSRFMNLNS